MRCLLDPSTLKAGARLCRVAEFQLVTSDMFRGNQARVRSLVPTNGTSGPITVVTRAGSAVSPTSFVVTRISAPVVEGFSPKSGKAGDSITVNGTGLTNVIAVEFNGIPAVFVSLGPSIHAKVPTNAASGPITITTPGGTAASEHTFVVLNPS